MQQGKSYIRDSEDFLSKIRNFTSIPDGSSLVRVNVVGLYPRIPHSAGLTALKPDLKTRKEKQIPTCDLLKMDEFVLGKNTLNFLIKCTSRL